MVCKESTNDSILVARVAHLVTGSVTRVYEGMMAWARAGRFAAPRPPLLLLIVLVVITKSVLVVIPWVLTRVV